MECARRNVKVDDDPRLPASACCLRGTVRELRQVIALSRNGRTVARRLGIAAVTVAALVLPATCDAAVPGKAVVAPVWQDEFTGPAGAPPDPSRWLHQTGGGGWGNAELQNYTADTANAALDGQGHLVITADAARTAARCWYGPCRYTSAALTTYGRFMPTFGRIEARIKLPRGQGVFPAFWTVGSNVYQVGWPASGEIDIVERLGNEPRTVHNGVHAPDTDTSNGYDVAVPDLSDDFHVFATDWSPSEIRFSVDGRVLSRVTKDEIPVWPFDKPQFLILNVAVGGGWPGPPDPTTPLPARMLVDYVRVYPSTA